MSEPFEDVRFPTEHPAARVAEHEVLMSFVNDEDAAMFQDWWEVWGKHLFGAYVPAPESKRPAGIPSRKEMYAIIKARSEELKRWYDDE
jgi:hypothetical protein